LGSLAPDARPGFLAQCRDERPDLAPAIEAILEAPTKTHHLPADEPFPGRHCFAPGDAIAARYLVISCVGVGGMGEVYQVEDTHMRERGNLALKTVRADLLGDPRSAARFEREVRHSLELAHPNVCRVYDVSRHTFIAPDSEILFLTMEFLSGGTLSRWLKQPDGKPRVVPEREAMPLIRQLAAGLAAIHRRRIIHRDFKPLNVMLVPSGSDLRAVITDLGLARMVRRTPDDDGDRTLTQAGASPGTPAYMAPELKSGTAPVSCAADLYSFGVTALEILTANRNVAKAAANLKTAGVSSRLISVILKCLNPEPAKRYRDAGEAVAALDNRTALPRLPLRAASAIAAVFLLAAAGLYWRAHRAPFIPPDAMTWYRQGAEDMQSGSYYAALKKFKAAEGKADFPMVHVRMAEAWYGLEGHNNANKEMLRAVGDLSPEESEYREGVRLALDGRRDKAVDSFRAYAAHASDSHAAQLTLALALERAGHPDEARKIYAGLIDFFPWVSLRLAVMDAGKGDWKKANPEFDTALARFRQATNAEGETEALSQRGLYNLQAYRFDEARRLLNQVLDRVQLTHNAFQQVRAQIEISSLEVLDNHTDLAIRLASQAMQSATEQGVEVLYNRAYRGLGNAYKAAGDYTKAEAALLEAVSVAREDSDEGLEAGTLALLSDLHNTMGRLTDAAEEGKKALAYYDKYNRPQLGVQAARVAANACRDLGRFQEAAELASHALSLANSDGLTGMAEESAGNIELARQHYSEAAIHLRKALEANTRAKAPVAVSNETTYLGAALAALGEFSEASALFDTATRRAAGDADSLEGIRLARAQLELYRNNPSAAAALVAKIPADPTDPDETAKLALIADAGQTGALAARAQALLQFDRDGVSFALRKRIRFAAASDLYRARDLAGATAALGAPADYAEMAELSWRALLLESQLKSGEESAALQRQSDAALLAGAPWLGYSVSDKISGTRPDLRDELREITIASSENEALNVRKKP
jgi:tetratricopeptide (TPR) repeat protein